MIQLATTAIPRLLPTSTGQPIATSQTRLVSSWTMTASVTSLMASIRLTIFKANLLSITHHCQSMVLSLICPSQQWCPSGLNSKWPTISSIWQSTVVLLALCSSSSCWGRFTCTASLEGTLTRRKLSWRKSTQMLTRMRVAWLINFCQKLSESTSQNNESSILIQSLVKS